MEHDPKDRRFLAESYERLEHALTLLDREDQDLRAVLVKPYTGDPADPSVVADWRRKASRMAKAQTAIMLHDRAIEKLARYLAKVDLYVVFPKRMSSREEKQVERMNDELFGLYVQFRFSDGMSRNKAIEKAADHCGYSRSRAYEIVNVRERRKFG